MHDYWHRQETDKPLYADILWSRPENKRLAKKLVSIGGNSHAFMNVAASYELVLEAGIGSCRVVLPDKLEKVIGKSIENVVYLPSDASGGISKDAVNAMHGYAEWGNGVFFSGDLGHSSETAVFTERFVRDTNSNLILSGDSLDAFYENPDILFDKEGTLFVADIKQLQKMAPKLGISTPVTHAMSLLQLVEVLHEVTADRESMIITHNDGITAVAMYGEVSTTQVLTDDHWQIQTASKAAVFFLQHPEKPFQAVTTSLIQNT